MNQCNNELWCECFQPTYFLKPKFVFIGKLICTKQKNTYNNKTLGYDILMLNSFNSKVYLNTPEIKDFLKNTSVDEFVCLFLCIALPNDSTMPDKKYKKNPAW